MDLSNINKKLFKYVFIVIGVFVAILLIFGIVKLITGGKLSYQKIEDKMVSAAKSYVKDKDVDVKLPEGEEVISVSVDDLVANKNMKALEKYIKNDEIKCTGNVVIRKKDNEYLYIPSLDCGKEYKTTSLSDYLINKVGTVTSNDGLYSMNNEYVFRGEFVNNYVEFAGQKWRILKIDADGNIKLLQEESSVRSNWDNRYNVDNKSTVGINDYIPSRMNEKLEELYDQIFTDKDKIYITEKNLCIGKRYLEDTSKNGTTECIAVYENQKIGLIQINEFLLASIDENCTKIRDGACQNYNYLAKYKEPWWTVTANAANTSEVYEVTGKSTKFSIASINKIVRVTTYLNNDVIYVSGDGSLENPYKFK